MTHLDARQSGLRPNLLSAADHHRLVLAGFHPTPIVRRPLAHPQRNVP